MKKFLKIVLVVILVLGILLGVGASLRGKMGTSQPETQIVRIETPLSGDLIESINAPGEVQPRTKVAISARVMARIVELPVNEGGSVTKGAPDEAPPAEPSLLVRLDAQDLEAALHSAEARRSAQAAQIEVEQARLASQRAEIDAIKASYQKAERDFQRCKTLLKSRDMSQSDLDDAQSRYDEIKAQLASAEYSLKASATSIEVAKHQLKAADAEIVRARDAVSYTTITSPIDGVVTRINAKVGEMVVTGTMNNPGTVIMEVADLSQMLVEVHLDEADVGKAKVGQRAIVQIRAYPDQPFEGILDSIALTHDNGQEGKYYKTRILLDTTEQQIRSGLTADVDIETEKHAGVLQLPSQAVLGRPIDDLPLLIRENNPAVDTKKAFATVVYRFIDGKAVVTPVSVGPSDATHTVILSGVSLKDRVIVGPYKILDTLKDGEKVRDEREVEEAEKEEGTAKAGKSDAEAPSTE